MKCRVVFLRQLGFCYFLAGRCICIRFVDTLHSSLCIILAVFYAGDKQISRSLWEFV